MEFVETGIQNGKTLMLLPGTACDYQTNFAAVLDRLSGKYHLICVNYDGFDGSGLIFPDIITVTGKIETYVKDHFEGRLDYTMSEAGGASEFVREYTLASGGPYCDCGYKKLNHT